MNLVTDPDIVEEARVLREHLAHPVAPLIATSARSFQQLTYVPLNVVNGTFVGTPETAALLKEVGGGEAIRAMTEKFYAKCFDDPHISQFIQNTGDPHAERLANWIVEKMGGEGRPWTEERAVRSKCPVHVQLGDGSSHVVHDRTSAHVAAWFSPKRDESVLGQRFKIHDALIWMRLMFWSARETGLLDQYPAFQQWYVDFISHFIAVYKRSASRQAYAACMWSADHSNIDNYVKFGNRMKDIKQYFEK